MAVAARLVLLQQYEQLGLLRSAARQLQCCCCHWLLLCSFTYGHPLAQQRQWRCCILLQLSMSCSRPA